VRSTPRLLEKERDTLLVRMSTELVWKALDTYSTFLSRFYPYPIVWNKKSRKFLCMHGGWKPLLRWYLVVALFVGPAGFGSVIIYLPVQYLSKTPRSEEVGRERSYYEMGVSLNNLIGFIGGTSLAIALHAFRTELASSFNALKEMEASLVNAKQGIKDD
jgi:hypothetical protein